MPRKARGKSYTNTYHVILRGIDRQNIFLDEKDMYKFKNEVIKTKEKYNYEIYSYVFMDNHVHFIIKLNNEFSISKIMQSLQIRYSIYFNKKYNRVGHLFQNRFKSMPIETTKYLLNLQRYIHQNPLKSGIGKTEKYKWSSYKDYISGKGITQTKIVLAIFDNKREIAINRFIEFNKRNDDNNVLEYELNKNYTDSELIKIIQDVVRIKDIEKVRQYNSEIRSNIIKSIVEIKNINKTQLARILGINRKMIERAIKQK